MKKGLNPWVREHRTSLPSQGPSLVSRIWPCVAYSCWILSSRGTKRPDIFLKNGKKGDSESTECNTKETDSWRIAPTPAGAQDGWTWRHGPEHGGGTSEDREPPTAGPELSVQDPPNGAHAAGLSHLAVVIAGTKTREAEGAALVQMLFRVTLRKSSVDLRPVLPMDFMRRDLPSCTGFCQTRMPFPVDFEDLIVTFQ